MRSSCIVCRPFHDTDTSVAQDIEARFGLTEMEVTDEVFESAQSKVFDEAGKPHAFDQGDRACYVGLERPVQHEFIA